MCSHCLWNAPLGVLDEGPPKRERREGGGEHGEREREREGG